MIDPLTAHLLEQQEFVDSHRTADALGADAPADAVVTLPDQVAEMEIDPDGSGSGRLILRPPENPRRGR